MQNSAQDIRNSDQVLNGANKANKYYGRTRGNHSGSDMSIDFSESDQNNFQNLTSQLRTESDGIDWIKTQFNINLKGADQNVDMENCSTQASSLQSTQTFNKDELNGEQITCNSFSAKFAAPTKHSNRGYYKGLLKDINKKEFSGDTFMNKLNKWDNKGQNFIMLQDQDDNMSLETHLETLSSRYTTNSNNLRKDKSYGEDLQMKIIPKSLFAKGVQIAIQTKRRYYQKTKKWTTSINITMPSNVKQSELLKNDSLFKPNRAGDQTCFEFFRRFNREYWDKGLNILIKVNDEPVFPAKMTMDYLCSLYKNSDTRLSLI
jgi:hypothetical protein